MFNLKTLDMGSALARTGRAAIVAGLSLLGSGLADRAHAASSCVVQPLEFNRLQIGMTAAQINTILGCPGVRAARGALGQTPVTAAEWRGPRRGTYVRVVYVGLRAGQIGWIRDTWP